MNWIKISGVVLLLVSCNLLAATAKPALTVTTVNPQSQLLSQRVLANGSVAAWQEMVISSQSQGLSLQQLLVEVGDTVKAGQLLLSFNAETLQVELAQANAALAEAQANRELQHDELQRVMALIESGAVSEREVQQKRSADKMAAAKLAAAEAQQKALQLKIKQSQIYAPDSGVVSARLATLGSVVNPGGELLRLIRQGRLEWRAEVTAAELAWLKPGGKVYLRGEGAQSLVASIRKISPVIDARSRLALVYVDLPPQTQWRAGMFAKGEFELGQQQGLTVPQQAVVIRDGFSYVFRLNQDKRVSQLKVQTGQRRGDRVEIVSGVNVKDTLVLKGAGFLNDGDLVNVTK